MPDLERVGASVILCAASADALDRLIPPGHGARTLRTAPDEALFVTSADVGRDVLREVEDRIAALDPDTLTLDVSDGWAFWSLRGSDAHPAFLRVSLLELPPEGWAQGDVAHLPAKVLTRHDAGTDEVLLLVAASVGDHLRARLVHDARAVEVAS